MDLDTADIGSPVQVLAAYSLKGDRIYSIETDYVVTRLVFNPSNWHLPGNSLGRLSKLLAFRMQSEFRDGRAYCQNAQWRSVLGELRVLFQAARDCCNRHRSAERMTHNHNFIDVAFADSLENTAGEIVNSRFHFRSLTMKELPRKNRIIESMFQSPARVEPVYQRCASQNRDENAE